jgi:predicted deacetylase
MTDHHSLIVSIHDVTPPHWLRVKEILERLSFVGVRKRSLLVIPNFRGEWGINEHPDFVEWLGDCSGEGDEIVLHGYEHVEVQRAQGIRDKIKNRLYTKGEGEFLSFSYEEARNRIQAGIELFTKVGLKSDGFVAPAWLVSQEALRAAKDLGFAYTNSYLKVTDLATGESIFAPSLVFGPGNLNEDLSLWLQRVLSKVIIGQSLVRVVIHPPCIENSRRFEEILTIVREQLLRHRPVTYSEFVAGWRSLDAVAVG